MNHWRWLGLGGLTTLAACVVGPPVVVAPGGPPAPAPSYRDVFADAPDVFASPSPRPSPMPRGPLYRTERPLDVVVAGPGYLVTATRPDPRDWPDVVWDPLESTCRHASLSIL